MSRVRPQVQPAASASRAKTVAATAPLLESDRERVRRAATNAGGHEQPDQRAREAISERLEGSPTAASFAFALVPDG